MSTSFHLTVSEAVGWNMCHLANTLPCYGEKKMTVYHWRSQSDGRIPYLAPSSVSVRPLTSLTDAVTGDEMAACLGLWLSYQHKWNSISQPCDTSKAKLRSGIPQRFSWCWSLWKLWRRAGLWEVWGMCPWIKEHSWSVGEREIWVEENHRVQNAFDAAKQNGTSSS